MQLWEDLFYISLIIKHNLIIVKEHKMAKFENR